MDTVGINLSNKGISIKRLQSHSTSTHVKSKAINSNFIVDRDIIVCLAGFQATTPPPKVKTRPLVTLVSSKSKIQLESLNPSKTSENSE